MANRRALAKATARRERPGRAQPPGVQRVKAATRKLLFLRPLPCIGFLCGRGRRRRTGSWRWGLLGRRSRGF